LLQDKERNSLLTFKLGTDAIVDFTHTKIDKKGIELLYDVAKNAGLIQKIEDMFSGVKINNTEKRPVWHIQLRRTEEDEITKHVFEVKSQIKAYSDQIRNG